MVLRSDTIPGQIRDLPVGVSLVMECSKELFNLVPSTQSYHRTDRSRLGLPPNHLIISRHKTVGVLIVKISILNIFLKSENYSN